MSKTIREYCYTLDYNFYHNDGKTFTPITRKEYKEKTGESDYIIDKLRNSGWPYQQSDYFFLKTDRDYPVDWKIYNLVKYFNINFKTSGSEQGNGIFSHIMFEHNKDIFSFLENKFGKNKIIKKVFVLDKTKTAASSDRLLLIKKYKKQIVFVEEEWIYLHSKKIIKKKIDVMYFHTNIISWIYETLNIKMADHSKAHKGNRIM